MSATDRPEDSLSHEHWQLRETILDRFEDAWRRGERPAVEEHRPTGLASGEVLPELIQTDLEYRLKAGEPVRVEEYLTRFPEVADDPAAVLDLLATEFTLRLRREPDLTSEEYGRRFPQHRAALLERLGELGEVHLPGYEIMGELGRGGMGVVYKALQLRLNRTVALKMVLAAVHAGPRELSRFRREAEAAARLQHPNIIQVYEVGEQAGRPYLSMEYAEGGSLAQRTSATPWEPRRAAELVATLARAMQAAHQRGIIHCDLKPANVLLSADGTPKISDFGLARQMEQEARHSLSGAILGTPAYMAPEQAAGSSGEVGSWTDVYALGAILYELLCGRPPFKAESSLATLQQVASEEPLPPSRLRPRIHADLETVCLKCLRKDPQSRYQSAQELADDLGRFLSGEPILARPAGVWERTVKWARRRPAWAALVVVGLAASLGLGAAEVHHRLQLREALTAAQTAQEQALGRERQVRQYLYASDVRQASHYWKEGDVKQARARLARHLPQPGGPDDLRGFEWHYFWRLVRSSDPLTVYAKDQEVSRAAFSPDGRMVALADPDGRVTVRDTDTGLERANWTGAAVSCLAFSPDGGALAIVATDGKVQVWDAATGRRETFPGCPRGASNVTLSPDLRLLAAQSSPGTLTVCDVASGKELAELKGDAMITTLTFAPDCRTVGIGYVYGRARLLDVLTGKEHRTLWLSSFAVSALDFTPDGRAVVAGCANGNVYLVDLGRHEAALLGSHGGAVRAVAVAADGQTVASAGNDTVVTWWDLRERTSRGTFKGHTEPPLALRYSPDGKGLFSAGSDGMVKRWPLSATDPGPDWQPLAVSVRPTGLLACSPDGKTLALADQDGSVKLLGVDGGRAPLALRGHAGAVRALAFAPGGALVSAGEDGTVRLWDVTSGRESLRLGGARGGVHAVALSPDGGTLACGGVDRTIELWHLSGAKQRGRLSGHSGSIESLTFSPDGRALASGCSDGMIKLWDVAAMKETAASRAGSAVAALAFAPGGKTLASAHPTGHIRLWDAGGRPEARMLAEFAHDTAPLYSLAFTPSGKDLLAGTEHGYVCFWDPAARRERRFIRGRGTPVRALAFAPDGKLAVGQPDLVRLWDLAGWEVRTPLGQSVAPVRALAFSPDSKTLFTGTTSGVEPNGAPKRPDRVRSFTGHINFDRAPVGGANALRLWDLSSRTERPRLTGQQTMGVLAVALSRDGRTLAAGGAAGAAWVWDLRTGAVGQPLFLTPQSRSYWGQWDMAVKLGVPMYPEFRVGVWAVALSGDGSLLAAVSDEATAKLWELPGGRERAVVPLAPGRRPCLALSPDATLLAVCDGGQIHLHDTADGRLRQRLWPHRDPIRCLAFSPDGRLLAAGGEGREIQCWDLPSGRERVSLIGHKDQVSALAFTPDGRTLASASWDGTVRLWHVSTGQELCALEGTRGRVHAVAFSPDGGTLATGGDRGPFDGEVRLWQTGP